MTDHSISTDPKSPMAGTVIPTLTTDPPTTASSATGPPGPTPAPSPSNRPSSPARDDQPQENGKEKLTYLADNPILNQFLELLPGILSETGHYEMWGVPLKDAYDAPTVNVLIKFLRANDGSVAHAQDQLTKALQWRHEMDPLALMEEKFNRKYEGIGYFAVYEHEGVGHVVTWNVYGAMREGDVTEVFGDVDEFIKWRVALMELAIKELKLDETTTVMDYNGEDPYQMIQVHDYQNVKFMRMNPAIRAASRKTIEVFSTAYPELLREKFFVNVPMIMGWMFTAMKMILSKKTTRKFHPITNGINLAREFPGLGEKFPAVYGGNGPDLVGNATSVLFDDSTAPAKNGDAANGVKEESAKEDPKIEPEVQVAAEAATEGAEAR